MKVGFVMLIENNWEALDTVVPSEQTKDDLSSHFRSALRSLHHAMTQDVGAGSGAKHARECQARTLMAPVPPIPLSRRHQLALAKSQPDLKIWRQGTSLFQHRLQCGKPREKHLSRPSTGR